MYISCDNLLYTMLPHQSLSHNASSVPQHDTLRQHCSAELKQVISEPIFTANLLTSIDKGWDDTTAIMAVIILCPTCNDSKMTVETNLNLQFVVICGLQCSDTVARHQKGHPACETRKLNYC